MTKEDILRAYLADDLFIEKSYLKDGEAQTYKWVSHTEIDLIQIIKTANAANEKRIDLINQLHDKKTRLEIIDKKNIDGTAAGTTVIISIPFMSIEVV